MLTNPVSAQDAPAQLSPAQFKAQVDAELVVVPRAALDAALAQARSLEGPVFIEAMSATGARADLGRPTTTAMENKLRFMEYLRHE